MQVNLTTYMGTVQKYPERLPMWHEAGHAVVAMHLKRKVYAYGLTPMPHCLMLSFGLSKHEKGVLLCAGAAMTKAVYGFEWGGECTDYKMAEALGDLNVFKAEADKLVNELLPQAKHLVESRLGTTFSKCTSEDRMWFGDDPEEFVPTLTEDMPHYEECVVAGEKAVLPTWAHKVLMAVARFQMNHPRFMAKVSGV